MVDYAPFTYPRVSAPLDYAFSRRKRPNMELDITWHEPDETANRDVLKAEVVAEAFMARLSKTVDPLELQAKSGSNEWSMYAINARFPPESRLRRPSDLSNEKPCLHTIVYTLVPVRLLLPLRWLTVRL